jgi:endonuclease YncB( thermonuclease family)
VAASHRDEGTGKVIGIVDGDTVDVLLSPEEAMALGYPRRKTPLPIRLRVDQVDTPERGQPWSNRAKQALSELIFGRDVRFTLHEVDRYERGVADLFLGDLWVNGWLVEQGHGWAYRRYLRQAALLCRLEEQARDAGRGLWSQPAATWIPPTLWRRKETRVVPAVISRAECLAAATAKH